MTLTREQVVFGDAVDLVAPSATGHRVRTHSGGTTRWHGRADFAMFGAAGSRLATPDPTIFEAKRRVFEVPELRVESWILPAMAGEQPATARDTTTVRIDVIRAGDVLYRVRDQVIHAGAGSAHLLPCDTPTAFRIAQSCEVVRLTLRGSMIPPLLHANLPALLGPLPASRLLAALDILCDELLTDEDRSPIDATAEIVKRLVRTLLRSLASASDLPLRDQMLLHIDEHLGDPALSPGSIAEAFGVSVRWAHQVFNLDGTTIASHIRRQRCEAVAVLLRAGPGLPRISALAADHGFAGRDQFTRAFKTHFGVTIADYLDAMSGAVCRGRSDDLV